jgi:MFS family permease
MLMPAFSGSQLPVQHSVHDSLRLLRRLRSPIKYVLPRPLPTKISKLIPVFAFPSVDLVLKKFRPSRFLPIIAISWGLVQTFQGFVQNYAGLLVCRFLLGGLECSLFPGISLYLSVWYKRGELSLRIALFFSCVPSSTLTCLFSLQAEFVLSDHQCCYDGWRFGRYSGLWTV